MTTQKRPRGIPCRYKFLIVLTLTYLNVYATTTIERGFFFKENKRISSIPFQVIDNLIVIDLELNDRKKVKAVFDTGIRSIMLFGSKYKKHLDYSYTREIPINGLGTDKRPTGNLTIDNSLDIGDIRGEGVAIVHVSHSLPFDILHQAGVEAVIGYQLFTSFVVEIDYNKQEVVFHDPKTYYNWNSSYSFPIEIIDTKPYITTSIKLGDQENVVENVKLLMDTGASVDMIIYGSSEKSKFFEHNSRKQQLIGFGLNGDIRGDEKACQLQLGPIDLGMNVVSIINPKSDDMISRRFGVDGLIGSKVLRNYVVTFDYIHKMVYLKSNS